VTIEQERPPRARYRRLPYLAFAVIVIVCLVIIQAGGLLASHAAGVSEDHGFVTSHNVLISLWIPTGAALVFTCAVVAFLGWWRPVLTDDRPVQRWVRVWPTSASPWSCSCAATTSRSEIIPVLDELTRQAGCAGA
jgi:CAAX protease family protein